MFFKKLTAPTGVLCGLMSLCAPGMASQTTAAALAPQVSSAEQVHPSYNLYGGYFELGALPFGLAAYGRFGYVLGQPSSRWLLDSGLNLSIGAIYTGASVSVNPRYIFESWTLGPEVTIGYSHFHGNVVGIAYGSVGLRGTYQIQHLNRRDSAVTFGVYVMPSSRAYVYQHNVWLSNSDFDDDIRSTPLPYISVGYIF
ncbi:MAG: hypothetical protein ACOYKZ_05325 [Chlamydiia bacterium]